MSVLSTLSLPRGSLSVEDFHPSLPPAIPPGYRQDDTPTATAGFVFFSDYFRVIPDGNQIMPWRRKFVLSLVSGLLGPFVPDWDDFDYSRWVIYVLHFLG